MKTRESSSVPPQVAAVLWTALSVSVCGLTVFWSISQHFVGTVAYNSVVADTVLLCATMLLPALLVGGVVLEVSRQQLFVLAIVACLAILSTVMSPNELYAGARLRIYYTLIVFWVLLVAAFRRCHRHGVLAVLLMLAMVHMFFLVTALKSAATPMPGAQWVVPPYFSNVRHFGYHGFIGASAAISIVALDSRFRAAGLVLVSASLFGVILYGSRGAILAWLICVGALLFMVANRREIFFIASSALVIALVGVYVADRNELFHTLSLLERAAGVGGDSISSTFGRVAVWRASLAAIVDRPIVGYGPDGFLVSGCCPRAFVQPHNSILQLTLEFGLVGLAAIGTALVVCLGKRIRRMIASIDAGSLDSRAAATMAILIGFGAFSLIDGVIYHIVPLIHFVIVAALFVSVDVSVPRLDSAETGESALSG